MFDNNKLKPRYARLVPSLIAIAVIGIVALPIFVPVFLGFLLSGCAWTIEDKLLETDTKLSSKLSAKTRSRLAKLFSLGLTLGSVGGFFIAAIIAFSQVYTFAGEEIGSGGISGIIEEIQITQTWQSIRENMHEIADAAGLSLQELNVPNSLIEKFSSLLTSLVASTPDLAIELMLVLITFTSVFLNRKRLSRLGDSQNSFSPKVLRVLSQSFNSFAFSTLFATLICALAQGLFIGLGAWIAGAPQPLLWTTLAAVTAVIPLVGTAPISLILGAYFMMNYGLFSNQVLIALCFGIGSGLLDNFLRPFLIGGTGDLHPAINLLAIFGGLASFGPWGLFIGPILVGVAIELLSHEAHLSEA